MTAIPELKKEKMQAEMLERLYMANSLALVIDTFKLNDQLAAIDLDLGSNDPMRVGPLTYRVHSVIKNEKIGFQTGDFVSISPNQDTHEITIQMNVVPISSFLGRLIPDIFKYFPWREIANNTSSEKLSPENAPDTIYPNDK